MRRTLAVLFSALLLLSVAAAQADASITKVLFSEPTGSIGLQVTQSGSNADLFFLTFVPEPIDAAILAGTPVLADPSIGWDVVLGPFVVDRTTRLLDTGGNFASYSLLAPPALTVRDGLTTRLSADVALGKLWVKVGGNFGGMDSPAGLKNLTVTPGASTVFQEFAKYGALDWGFSYTGLNLDAYLLAAPAYSGYAAAAGYIMVPEPATLALVAGGVAAALARRRRR